MPDPKRKYSYDPKCADLADYFLEEEPGATTITEFSNRKAELAQCIQDAVEDFLRTSN